MTTQRLCWLLPVVIAMGCEIAETPPNEERPLQCQSTASVACTPSDNLSSGSCESDADCEQGSCIDYFDGCFCGAKSCNSDADCSSGKACGCGELPGLGRNACLVAECRSNDDCSGGVCRYSRGGTNCCDTGDAKGFFCSTGEDECNADSDCDGTSVCLFSEGLGRFQCGNVSCSCD